MSALVAVMRELVALFVDDSALALAVLLVAAAAAVLAFVLPASPLAAGAVLLFGTLGVLLLSVQRAAR
jgi:uncharacterized membrane protein YdjX (TVP38/TMEM64 family)